MTCTGQWEGPPGCVDLRFNLQDSLFIKYQLAAKMAELHGILHIKTSNNIQLNIQTSNNIKNILIRPIPKMYREFKNMRKNI